MPAKAPNNKLFNAKFWRNLTNFWTVVLFGFIIVDFFLQNTLSGFIGPVAAIYIAVLAVYTAEKEFERWNNYNIGIHPGELYVYAWTILVILLFVLEIFNRDIYKLPNEVFTTYIVVIGVLAITKRSKKNYLSKKGK